MTLDAILKYCNFIMNRDQLGDPVDPEDFNIIIQVCNIEKYNADYDELLKMLQFVKAPQNPVTADALFSTRMPLKRFFKTSFSTDPSTMLIKPTDFSKLLQIWVHYTAEKVWRKVEILMNPDDLSNRLSDFMSMVDVNNPVGYETNTDFRIYPDLNIARFQLHYLRKVLDAYYDWAITESDNYIYLPPGSVLENNGGIIRLKIDGVVVANNLTKDNVSFPYTSSSVELDWDVDDHPSFCNFLIEKMSAYNRETMMMQYSQLKKQQQ